VLSGALRRLTILVAVVVGLTTIASLMLGALVGASLLRALADGFYVAGAAILLSSFVIGMRGPVRAEWGEGSGDDEVQVRRSVLMPRMIRRTTPLERMEARRNSVALFALGLALVLVGTAFDPTRHAF
jgi:hypothetical protein